MASPSRRAILLLDSHGAALGGLEIASSLVALRTRIGLLVAGDTAGASDLRLVRSLGARVFEETEDRVFEEVADEVRVALDAPRQGETEVLLASAGGELWTVDDPARWRPLADVLSIRVGTPPGPGLPQLQRRRLVLGPAPAGGGRGGILGRGGEGSRAGERLGMLRPEDLDELRLGRAAGGWWWLHARRGLPLSLSVEGPERLLRNLGTAREPVLVPGDRAPVPDLPALRIRSAFAVPEGAGLLWWDTDGGERHVIFERRHLARIDPELARSFEW